MPRPTRMTCQALATSPSIEASNLEAKSSVPQDIFNPLYDRQLATTPTIVFESDVHDVPTPNLRFRLDRTAIEACRTTQTQACFASDLSSSQSHSTTVDHLIISQPVFRPFALLSTYTAKIARSPSRHGLATIVLNHNTPLARSLFTAHVE